MFHVAVLVNENEVAHSAFADTQAILKRPVALGDQKLKTYRFASYDKYNIQQLFIPEATTYLLNYDALVLATNATNNIEILDTLKANAPVIDEFIQAGKGILICAQKKLSQALSNSEPRRTGFLPERFEYMLYDRPEVSSADGTISIVEPRDRLFNYPNDIDDDLLEDHCVRNDFMEHKYRSHLVPAHASHYLPLLLDSGSPPVPKALRVNVDQRRVVLMRTGNRNERLVVTSMALDWAGHEELIENILVYISEGTAQLAIVRRRDMKTDFAMDAYVIRARVAKIPVREYFDLSPSAVGVLEHSTIVVSPAYTEPEVRQIWNAVISSGGMISDLYHMTTDSSSGGLRLTRFSSSSLMDRRSASAAEWLTRSFFPSLWGKSVWTYNYVLPMLQEVGLDVVPYVPYVYRDLAKHIQTRESATASYDNVVNATTQLIELLHSVFCDVEFDYSSLEGCSYPDELLNASVKWLYGVLTGRRTNSLRDQLYMLNTLNRVGVEDAPNDALALVVQTTLLAYRDIGYAQYEPVELVQLLELMLVTKQPDDTIADVVDLDSEIALVAAEICSLQGIDGQWRNISETAEMTLILLRLTQVSEDLAHRTEIAEAILKGIEFLLLSYGDEIGNWHNDINATAKAAHALALFDKYSGMSGGDFFAEIRDKTSSRAAMEANHAAAQHDGELLRTLFDKDTSVASQRQETSAALDDLRRTRITLRRFQAFTLGSTVIALISAGTLALIFTVLIVSYRDVAKKLLGNWNEYLISAFVGIVLTLLATGVYTFAKQRLLDSDKD